MKKEKEQQLLCQKNLIKMVREGLMNSKGLKNEYDLLMSSYNNFNVVAVFLLG